MGSNNLAEVFLDIQVVSVVHMISQRVEPIPPRDNFMPVFPWDHTALENHEEAYSTTKRFTGSH